MDCNRAEQLFDAYLDGELSEPLISELEAHRLYCPQCRHELALLEVSRHMIVTDEAPSSLSDDFTDRLMAIVQTPGMRPRWTMRRIVAFGAPLAAAAVIMIALLGGFERKGVVAGREVTRSGVERPVGRTIAVVAPTERPAGDATGEAAQPQSSVASRVDDEAVARWLERSRERIDAQRRSGQSVLRALDLTVLQLLDMLQSAGDTSLEETHYPGSDAAPDVAVDGEPEPLEDL